MLFDMLREIDADPIPHTAVIAACGKHERLEVRRKAKELLDKFVGFALVKAPIGPYQGSTQYLDACRVHLRGAEYGPAQAQVKGFIEMLKLLAAVVDGDTGAREYRPGTKSRYHDHIAQKFVDDHLAVDKRDAEVHAAKRLGEHANVPASTGILRADVQKLDFAVGALNKLQAFDAVEEYLQAVGSYRVGTADEEIDSVCYLTGFKVSGWIFTRAGADKLQIEPIAGYLAYSAVADDAKPGHWLAYHYQDVVAAPDTLPRARAGQGWRRATFADFRRKCPHSKIRIAEGDWPVVYYTVNL